VKKAQTYQCPEGTAPVIKTYTGIMISSERYERQVFIEGWGEEGQARLAGAHVGIAGVGGLGSPASTYIAAAGVGRITLCDFQGIELSNLNRQVLYVTDEIGKPKEAQAARRLSALNPEIEIITHDEPITNGNVAQIFSDCDIVVDCLDNPTTRLVLNRFCVDRFTPLVHAGVWEFYGQVMLIDPPKTSCLACFLSVENGEEGPIPIAGTTAGVLGCMEANLVVRYLLGMTSDVAGAFISVDLTTMQSTRIAMVKNPACQVCGA
jgi:adenylyltransferase/sulfurtransferase